MIVGLVVFWITFALRTSIRSLEVSILKLVGSQDGRSRTSSIHHESSGSSHQNAIDAVNESTKAAAVLKTYPEPAGALAQRLLRFSSTMQYAPASKTGPSHDIERDASPKRQPSTTYSRPDPKYQPSRDPGVTYTQPQYTHQAPAGHGYQDNAASRSAAEHPYQQGVAAPGVDRIPLSGSATASYSSSVNIRWWIPANGIRRDVIQADIQRYLGPEAVVRPGEGRDNDSVSILRLKATQSLTIVQGRSGYWIAAYRTLTPV